MCACTSASRNSNLYLFDNFREPCLVIRIFSFVPAIDRFPACNTGSRLAIHFLNTEHESNHDKKLKRFQLRSASHSGVDSFAQSHTPANQNAQRSNLLNGEYVFCLLYQATQIETFLCDAAHCRVAFLCLAAVRDDCKWLMNNALP